MLIWQLGSLAYNASIVVGILFATKMLFQIGRGIYRAVKGIIARHKR